MNSTLFYTIVIAFTSGVFLRSFFNIGTHELLVGVLIAIVMLVIWRIKTFGFNSPLLYVSIILLTFSCGVTRLNYAESYISPLQEHIGQKIVLYGTVAREPEDHDSSLIVYIKPSIDGAKELVKVSSDKYALHKQMIEYGDEVSVEGVLKEPESFATDGGRTFDYPGYLKARNVGYTMSFSKIEVLNESNSFLTNIYRLKHSFMNTLEQRIPVPESGLGEGVLLGVKRSLGNDLEEVFRETGIIHIVVLSGYNIMVVVEVCTYILSFFFFPKTRIILGVLFIVIFAFLVGFSATVVRASCMAILLIIARNTGRVYAVLRALMYALVGMLLYNPYLLVHDPGFQLSFIATLGLILFSPYIEERLLFVPAFLGMRMFLTATLATQIAVLPILLYQMGTLSLVAIFVNVLVLPMVPVAMGLTFLTGVLGTIPFLGSIFGFISFGSLWYIITIATLFAAIPFASFSVPAFPFWIVLISYGIMIWGYYYVRTRDVHFNQEKENPYQDWIIEEEKEKTTEGLQSNPSVGVFPFR